MPSTISALRSVLDNNVSFGSAIARKVPRSGRLLPILAVLGNMKRGCDWPLYGLLLIVAIGGVLPRTAHAQATGNTTIQPDCLIPFTLTAAGSFPALPTTGGAGDNRTKGCAAWTLMYQSTGLVMVSVTLQSGSSVSTTVSWGSFAGTISSGYVNPIVSDTGGSLQATNGTADISWVRVNVSATGTGTLTGVLYGFRLSSAAVTGGSGGTCNGLLGDVTGPCSATIAGKLHGGTQPTAFAALGAPANGTFEFCSDCTVVSSVDDTCAGSGAGAMASRLGGAWKCSL